MRLAAADLNDRTIVGRESGTGQPNSFIAGGRRVGARRAVPLLTPPMTPSTAWASSSQAFSMLTGSWIDSFSTLSQNVI